MLLQFQNQYAHQHTSASIGYRLQKMSSRQGPKYKALQLGGDHKNYMRKLQEQLEKSRMAVETITTSKNTENQLRKRVDEIQQELHQCMLSISRETKKNKILTQLISLLKSQMLKFQASQKKQEELQNTNQEKKTKKVEYDVEQVLQKYNEQVAKINLLKEQVNSRRSERVVFSNLFKKLQKQIKHYEEIYKHLLLRTEAAKDRPHQISQSIPSELKDIDTNLKGESQDRLSQKNLENCQEDINGFSGGQQKRHSCTVVHQASLINQMFLTQKEDNSSAAKNISVTPKVESMRETMVSKAGSKQRISSIEVCIEYIKTSTGYPSVDQICNHFSNLEQENSKLLDLIDEIEGELYAIGCEEQSIRQKKLAVKYCQQERQQSNQLQKVVCRVQENEEELCEIQKMEHEIKAIGELLGLELQGRKITNEDLKYIDNKISLIASKDPSKLAEHSPGSADNSDMAVDILLEKMDVFTGSEKILDKQAFRKAYYEEVGKDRRSKLSK